MNGEKSIRLKDEYLLGVLNSCYVAGAAGSRAFHSSSLEDYLRLATLSFKLMMASNGPYSPYPWRGNSDITPLAYSRTHARTHSLKQFCLLSFVYSRAFSLFCTHSLSYSSILMSFSVFSREQSPPYAYILWYSLSILTLTHSLIRSLFISLSLSRENNFMSSLTQKRSFCSIYPFHSLDSLS